MSDRSIILKDFEVRAFIEGRKTMKRIALKPQPNMLNGGHPFNNGRGSYSTEKGWKRYPISKGGRLWTKERVRAVDDDNTFGHQVEYMADGHRVTVAEYGDVFSDAYGDWWNLLAYRSDDPDLTGGKVVQPQHMPRWASRLTLIVEDVKVERLQDISEEDARAEGVFVPEAQYAQQGSRAPVFAFAAKWEEANGAGSWESNPWCAAYTFRPILKNIDAISMNEAA